MCVEGRKMVLLLAVPARIILYRIVTGWFGAISPMRQVFTQAPSLTHIAIFSGGLLSHGGVPVRYHGRVYNIVSIDTFSELCAKTHQKRSWLKVHEFSTESCVGGRHPSKR